MTVIHALTVLERLHQAVVVLSEGRVTYANAAALELFGVETSQALEPLGSRVSGFDDNVATCSPDEVRLCHIAREGEILWLNMRCSGDVSCRVLEFSIVETPTSQTHGIILASPRRYSELLSVVFNNTLTAMAILDPKFDFICVNPAYARAGLRSVEAYPGLNHFDLYPSDAIEFFEAVRTTLEPFQAFARPFEYTGHPEWGITYWDVGLVPVLDEQGELEMLVLSLNEVTERERAIRSLSKAQSHLQRVEKLESIGRLAAGVAHDFNNLLTVILTGSRLLLDDIQDESLCEDVYEIQIAAERAANLTQQLLSFGRQQLLNVSTVDLSASLGRVSRIVQSVLQPHIELVLELDEKLPSILGDSVHLERVILSIVLNARDAMPKGGRLRLVSYTRFLSAEEIQPYEGFSEGEFVVVEIEDEGKGMDENTLNLIFEPFFTTGKKNNAGLGLSSAFGLVRQLGGHLEAESIVGQGSTFRLLFPTSAQTGRPHWKTPSRETHALGAAQVVVVEDDPQVRRIIAMVLSRNGYQTQAMPSAKATLEWIEKGGGIDVLLTELVLPGMSGRELAARVRQVHPDVKLLYMSGYSDDFGKAETSGMATFLAKPFPPQQLLRALEKCLIQ